MAGEWSFDFNPRPPGAPLEVWGDLTRLIADALEESGNVATFREETGLGVVWVTPRTLEPDESGAP